MADETTLEAILKEMEPRNDEVVDYAQEMGTGMMEIYQAGSNAVGKSATALKTAENRKKFVDAAVEEAAKVYKNIYNGQPEKLKGVKKHDMFYHVTGLSVGQVEQTLNQRQEDFSVDFWAQLIGNHLNEVRNRTSSYLTENVTGNQGAVLAKAIGYNGTLGDNDAKQVAQTLYKNHRQLGRIKDTLPQATYRDAA